MDGYSMMKAIANDFDFTGHDLIFFGEEIY